MADEELDFNAAVQQRIRDLQGGSSAWNELTTTLSGARREGSDQGPTRHAATSNAIGGIRNRRVIQLDEDNNPVQRLVISDAQAQALDTEGMRYVDVPTPSTREEYFALDEDQRNILDWWTTAEKKERTDAAYAQTEPMNALGGMGMDILSAIPGVAPLVASFGEEVMVDGKPSGVTDIAASYAAYEEDSPWLSGLTYTAANIVPAFFTGGLSVGPSLAARGGKEALERVVVGGMKQAVKQADEAAGRLMGQSVMNTTEKSVLRKAAPFLVGGGFDIGVGKLAQKLVPKGMSPLAAERLGEVAAGSAGAIRDHMTDVMLDDRKDYSAETIVSAGVVGGLLGLAGDQASRWVGGKISAKGQAQIAEQEAALAGVLWQNLHNQADPRAFAEFLSDPKNIDEAYEKIADLLQIGTEAEVAQLPWGVKALNVMRSVMGGFAADASTLNRLATPTFQRGMEFAAEHLGKGDSQVFRDLGKVVRSLTQGGDNLRRLSDIATLARAESSEAQDAMDNVMPLSVAPGVEEASVRILPAERLNLLLERGARVPFTVPNAKRTLDIDGQPVSANETVNSNLTATMYEFARSMDHHIKPMEGTGGVEGFGGSSRTTQKEVGTTTESVFGVPLGVRQIEVIDVDGNIRIEWDWARELNGEATPVGQVVKAADVPAYREGSIINVSDDLDRVLTAVDKGETTLVKPAGTKPVTREDARAQLEDPISEFRSAVNEALKEIGDGKLLEVPAASTAAPRKEANFEAAIAKRQPLTVKAIELGEAQLSNPKTKNQSGINKKTFDSILKPGQLRKSGERWKERVLEAGAQDADDIAPVIAAFDQWEAALGTLKGLVGRTGKKAGTLLDRTGAVKVDADSTASWVAALESVAKTEDALATLLKKSDNAYPPVPAAAPTARASKGPQKVLTDLLKKIESGANPQELDKLLQKPKLQKYLLEDISGADDAITQQLRATQSLVKNTLSKYLRGYAFVMGEPTEAVFNQYARYQTKGGDSTLLSAYRDLSALAGKKGGTSGQQWQLLQNLKKTMTERTMDEKTMGNFYESGIQAMERLKSLTESEHLWGSWGLSQQQLNVGLNRLIQKSDELKKYLGKYSSNASGRGAALTGESPIESMKAAMFGKTNSVPDGMLPRMLADNMSALSMIFEGARRQGVNEDRLYRALAGQRPDGEGFAAAIDAGRDIYEAFPRIMGDAVEIQNALQARAEMQRLFGEQWQRAGLFRQSALGWTRIPANIFNSDPGSLTNRVMTSLDGILQQYIVRPISAESFLASVRTGVLTQRTKQVDRITSFKSFIRDTKPARRATVNAILTRSLPPYWAKCWIGTDAEMDEMYSVATERLRDALENTTGVGGAIAEGMPTDRLQNLSDTVMLPWYGTDYVPAGQAISDKLGQVVMDVYDRQPGMAIPGLPAGMQPPPHPLEKRKWLQILAAANEGASIMLPLMEAGMLDPELAQFCQQHFPLETGALVAAFAEDIQSGKLGYDVELGFETLLGVPITPTATPSAILAFQQANQGANTPAAAAATGLQRRGQVRMAGLAATDNELRQRRHERQGRA